MPVMSSPATLTLAARELALLRAGGGGGAPDRSRRERERHRRRRPSVIIAPIDCTCSEYSPGATPLSVKLPSLSVRDVPPGMNCIASFIVGISITIAPAHRLAVGADRGAGDLRELHRLQLDVDARQLLPDGERDALRFGRARRAGIVGGGVPGVVVRSRRARRRRAAEHVHHHRVHRCAASR